MNLRQRDLKFALTLFWVVIWRSTVYATRNDTATNKNLTFMLVTSFGAYGFNSSGTLPAAEIALGGINSREDILPGYNLGYDTVRDSKCNRQASLEAFFDGVMNDPTKVGVIGCGCSVATEPVAELIHRWNVPLISYGTTSASLSNTTIYQNYFRANPPSTTLTPALLALMNEFQWKRVGLLTQDENRFRRVESSVREMLVPNGIEVQSRTYSTENDPTLINDLFIESDDFRVFVLNSYPNSRIICEIFQRHYVYPRYAWITYGWYAQGSWTSTNGNTVNCTEEQLRTVLEKGISVEVFPIPEDKSASTIAGLTPQEFHDEYQAHAAAEGYEILDTTSAQLHDDVWGLALALNATMTMVNEGDISETNCEHLPGQLVPLEEFTYNNSKMGCLISWNLRRTTFSGVSGMVYFNESLIRNRATLFQYIFDGDELTRRQFATVDMDTNFTFVYENGQSIETLYPDGVAPDGTPETVVDHVLLPIAIIIDVLAFVGLIFSVICLLFNIVFREKRIVKLTSPNLNYFIIAGTISMYTSIYFYLIPTTLTTVTQASCLIREWLFTIGYTLAYGALLAKLWRVYSIFHNPAPNMKILRDWHLMVLTLIVAGIASVLLLFGTAIPQLRGSITMVRDLEFPDGISDQGIRIQNHVLLCYNEVGAALYWRIFVFAYLTILQILGIMLAFQTRKVKVKSLKDSPYVVANVYISSIIIVIFIITTFVLRSYLNVYSSVFATGIFILTTSFLMLTFAPKMIILYKDPNGDGMSDTVSSTYQKNGSDGNQNFRPRAKSLVEFMELEQKVANLKKTISEQETTIKKMKEERKLKEQTLP